MPSNEGMESVLADLRYGLRGLVRAPAFAAVTILTLALGIGANTAIFSTVDAVLLRALPYGDPDRIVMVWEDSSFAGFPRNTPAPANYVGWRARNHVFADVAATRVASANLTLDGPPEQVLGRGVTPNFFSVLKVSPLLGRAFTEDEDRSAARVVVISHGLWRRRYGGDPSIVGRTITMSGAATTVVGVMPPAFVFRNRDIDYWKPASFAPVELARRNSHYLNVVARLKPGVTLAQARDDMTAIAARLGTEYPDTNARVGVTLVPIDEEVVGGARLHLLILMAAAGCVLLIACANLASLLLARAIGRRGELGIRAALGAPRGRLVRQLVVEALVLSVLGAGVGLALAPAGMAVVERLVPTGLPHMQASALDGRVLTFTLVLAVVTGVAFSIVPALQAARASVNDALQHSSRGAVGGRGRTTRDALVVLQVATALVLLVAAGLMLRTLANLRALELGFRPDHVLTLRTSLPQQKYADGVAREAFFERVLDRVRQIPSVRQAAYGSVLPFQSIGNTSAYEIENRPLEPGDPGDALLRAGTADYLATLGARLVEGRLPDERDGPDAPAILVINETMARRYWPNQSALGHRVRMTWNGDPPWRTIVGVVRDLRERGYEPEPKPGAYVAYAQAPDTWAVPEYLVLRTTGDPTAVAAAAREAVAAVDPAQPVASVRTLDEIVELDVADRRQQATLLGAFAALALLLASVGLYGVLSYAVSQRSREIGLRMALGASRASVMRLVVGRGLALTAVGLACGAAGAWGATRAMASILYAVEPGDPVTFGAVVAVLCGVACAACVGPAVRAIRLSPLEALRDD